MEAQLIHFFSHVSSSKYYIPLTAHGSTCNSCLRQFTKETDRKDVANGTGKKSSRWCRPFSTIRRLWVKHPRLVLTFRCQPSQDIVQEFLGFKEKILSATGEICHVVPKPNIRDDVRKLLVSHAETLRGKLQTYGFKFSKIGNYSYPWQILNTYVTIELKLRKWCTEVVTQTVLERQLILL